VTEVLSQLLFNSIYVVLIQAKEDRIGDHFALYIPDKEIIFHRLSKLNFLGAAYELAGGGTTLMAEITFRPASYLASLSQSEILERVKADLTRMGFIRSSDIVDMATHYEKYAYVIYDLNHRKNVDFILGFLRSKGIYSCGRFAEFEYLNTDGVVERTLKLARDLNAAFSLQRETR